MRGFVCYSWRIYMNEGMHAVHLKGACSSVYSFQSMYVETASKDI